jgi:hypothetical protein
VCVPTAAADGRGSCGACAAAARARAHRPASARSDPRRAFAQRTTRNGAAALTFAPMREAHSIDRAWVGAQLAPRSPRSLRWVGQCRSSAVARVAERTRACADACMRGRVHARTRACLSLNVVLCNVVCYMVYAARCELCAGGCGQSRAEAHGACARAAAG